MPLIAFLVVVFMAVPSFAEVVTTTDGRQIKLNEDGTYEVLSTPIQTTDEFYAELDFAEFELFPEDWIGRAVWVARSSFGLTPVTKENIESGRMTINAGTGTEPNLVIADISSLSREDQVNLVRGDRYMAFGTIQKLRDAAAGSAQETVLLRVDSLVFDPSRMLRIQGGQVRIPVTP